jgi:hypothetical protein
MDKGKYSHPTDIVEPIEQPRDDDAYHGEDVYHESVEHYEQHEPVDVLAEVHPTNGLEGERPTSLLPDEEIDRLRQRWTEIQIEFVDNPQLAVEGADSLVTDLINRMARAFSDERSRLEDEWREVSDVSTEDLRVTLKYYRSFFNRLLMA